MAKAGKGGWIRHRGGECPVDGSEMVGVRLRDGTEHEGADAERGDYWIWEHDGGGCDIMAYRLHKPEPRAEVPEGYGEIVTATPDSTDGPLDWRDRIRAIDAKLDALKEERAGLVRRLADEGFSLIDEAPKPEPEEDMTDWRNWRDGDLVVCVSIPRGHSDYYTVGGIYSLDTIDLNDTEVLNVEVYCDRHISLWCSAGDFRWHSRPSSR